MMTMFDRRRMLLAGSATALLALAACGKSDTATPAAGDAGATDAEHDGGAATVEVAFAGGAGVVPAGLGLETPARFR